MHSQFILPMLSMLASLVMGALCLRRLKIHGAGSLAVLSFAVGLWSAVYLLYLLFPSASARLFCAAVSYLCAAAVSTALLAFCLNYTNRSAWISRSSLLLPAVLPLLTQILFWVGPWRNKFFIGQGFASIGLSASQGLLPRINAVYTYGLEILGVWLLIDTFVRKPRPLRLRSGAILLGAALPVLVRTADLISPGWISAVDLVLVTYTLSALGLGYGLLRNELLEFSPMSRDAVVEGMDDGWMVLDSASNIIDLNRAAEKMTGLARDTAYGFPIISVLNDWPNLIKFSEGVKEVEMKRSVKTQDGWRYVNIRISPLQNRNASHFGHLVVWRDITERRLAEDARQRARDEMFVLLNAISSAASHAMKLEDFLSESIYQIIYPFRSQVVAIFLMDEQAETEGQRLVLASHFGLSFDAINAMAGLPATSGLFSPVLEQRQPVQIDDVQTDPRAPAALREMEFSCFLIIPLIPQAGEEGKVLGCLCLARKERPVYSQDEVIRLATISDQIATLIDSDRRRQLAIALSERQRLLRDLHDSVSQKLYGLVTLTEAAQAALEAGSTVAPGQVLARIGENARQAVKEMRLFLYEMQPVDLEKEGLVSVLHHRLAAVEGRADIKARLLADENISLSKDKEITLYFIAQEALNNVLRHAHAKSVSVTLKQGRQNVILEILDDGRGFDPKRVDGGGWGLKNMRDRVSQVDGTLKISSKPEEGTKIIVTVSRNRTAKPIKKRA
jgi:PAS domain S-box-containing protein